MQAMRFLDSLAAPPLGLRLAAMVCALISLVALVAKVLYNLPMDFFLTFFGVPSILLLFMLGVSARWLDERIFLRCLLVGLVAGVVATAAYDLFRLAVRLSNVLDYDGFKTIYIFGSWISGKATNTLEAGIAGWIYHFWNGLSFAVFYALGFGRRPWFFGIAYGALMEAIMLGLFPLFLTVTNRTDFIVASMLGHMIYGAVLGMFVQRYAPSWREQIGSTAGRMAGRQRGR